MVARNVGRVMLPADRTRGGGRRAPGEFDDPTGSIARLVVQEHGPASDDDDELVNQTIREDGGACRCVDPHRAVHAP